MQQKTNVHVSRLPASILLQYRVVFTFIRMRNMMMKYKGETETVPSFDDWFVVSELLIGRQSQRVQRQWLEEAKLVSSRFAKKNQEQNRVLSQQHLEDCSHLQHIGAVNPCYDHITNSVSCSFNHHLLAELIAWLDQRTVLGKVWCGCRGTLPGKQEDWHTSMEASETKIKKLSRRILSHLPEWPQQLSFPDPNYSSSSDLNFGKQKNKQNILHTVWCCIVCH